VLAWIVSICDERSVSSDSAYRPYAVSDKRSAMKAADFGVYIAGDTHVFQNPVLFS
jgi:hypothetical protein